MVNRIVTYWRCRHERRNRRLIDSLMWLGPYLPPADWYVTGGASGQYYRTRFGFDLPVWRSRSIDVAVTGAIEIGRAHV